MRPAPSISTADRSASGTSRSRRRMAAKDSRLAVVTSQAPRRSGSRMRSIASTRRSQVVWLTSPASAAERRCERAIRHTRGEKRSTSSSKADWSPVAARCTSSPIPSGSLIGAPPTRANTAAERRVGYADERCAAARRREHCADGSLALRARSSAADRSGRRVESGRPNPAPRSRALRASSSTPSSVEVAPGSSRARAGRTHPKIQIDATTRPIEKYWAPVSPRTCSSFTRRESDRKRQTP